MKTTSDFAERISEALIRAYPHLEESMKKGDFKIALDRAEAGRAKLSIRWPNTVILCPDFKLLSHIATLAFPGCPPDRIFVKSYGIVGIEIECT